MSTQLSNPIESMFDFHRTVVEQNQALIQDTLEAQRTFIESMDQGVDAWRSISEQNAAFARALSESTFDNLEAVSPEEVEGLVEARETIEAQLEQVEDLSEETIAVSEDAIEESAATYAEFVESYLEALDAAVEAYLSAIGDLEASADSVAESIDVE